MKKALLVPMLVVLFALPARAQTAHFTGRDLVIKDSGKTIKIARFLPTVVPPDPPCVHSVEKRDGEFFVVVTTHEWSRGSPMPRGECGAGEESYVKWLHIVNGKVKESFDGLYESCLKNRDGSVVGWNGPLFVVTTDAELPDKVQANAKDIWSTITFTFDAHHPEQGLKEEDGPPHS